MKNILILGSNFGFKIYSKSLKKIYPNSKITICSPNIKKKNISKIFIKEESYKKILDKKKFDIIVFATNPKTQTNVIKYLYKKKYKLKE